MGRDIDDGPNLIALPDFFEKIAQIKILNQETGRHLRWCAGINLKISRNLGFLIRRFELIDAEIIILEFKRHVTEFNTRVFGMDIPGLQQDIGVHLLKGIKRQGVIGKQTALLLVFISRLLLVLF